MITALYTAASGMLVQGRKMDLLANNLANAMTPGFKAQYLLQVGQRPSDADRPTDVQTGYRNNFTDLSSGPMQRTGNVFDLAIEGDGYFEVELSDGEPAYTRAGNFRPDPLGVLRTSDGHPVMGQNGPVTLPANAANVVIDQEGRIEADGAQVDVLRRVGFVDGQRLDTVGNGLFVPKEEALANAPAGLVQQGYLEGSNVSGVEELTRMIESLRGFESYQRVITTVMDEATRRAVNDIGRV